MHTVLVPAERLRRWLENFGTRHGAVALTIDGGLVATAEDGAVATVRLPFGRAFGGRTVDEFAEAAVADVRWGLLVVRKGGFAVAAGTTRAAALSKVGRRHVQGRSKAGGWSQQRFARRRDNQARDAYEAAAEHAHRILTTEFGGVDVLVCGGDRTAVDAVLTDPRLAPLASKRAGPLLAVPDPNAAVLARAVADAWSCRVAIEEPNPGASRRGAGPPR